MRIYIVQKGDTLYNIAKAHNVSLDDLIKLNPHLSSPDYIAPGMKIKIPSEVKKISDEQTSEQIQSKQSNEAKTNERPMGNNSLSLYETNKENAQPSLMPAARDKQKYDANKDEERRIASAERNLSQPNDRIPPPLPNRGEPSLRYQTKRRRPYPPNPLPLYDQMAHRNRNMSENMYRPQYVCPCCMRPLQADYQMYPPYYFDQRGRRR